MMPPGVSQIKTTGKYRAQLRINGRNTHLGCFRTPEQAFQVYRNHLRQKLAAQIKELQ
jgi:hypothetical protein